MWGLAAAIFMVLAPGTMWAQTPMNPPFPQALQPGKGIITNKQWAIALGKALFWDQQTGSDGNACASCHFVAGADTRLKNQLNPGFNDVTFGPDGDTKFGSTYSDVTATRGTMPSGAWADSNYTLQPGDFPLHKLMDETDRNSKIISTTNDRISSQGAFDADFTRVKPFGQKDSCSDVDKSVFHAGHYAARQVEPRNTPTTINAVFNQRNFLDGRANSMFNGVGTFGMRDINGDPNARLIIKDPKTGKLSLTYLTIEDASLASQAVTPVISQIEMSCDGRTFADVGKKLLETLPLAHQQVDPNDSVLGAIDKRYGKGLAPWFNYRWMIQQAFDPQYWSASGKYRIVNGMLTKDPTGYDQIEINFSMFWGIAIMEYEATLVSNQSEYDTLTTSGQLVLTPQPTGGIICTPATLAVDPLLVRGCNLFNGVPFIPSVAPGFGEGCLFCHGAPTFSEAEHTAEVPFPPFLTATDLTGLNDLRDNGFANIGIRPVFTDLMSGRVDAYNNPLSYGRQYKNYLDSGPDAAHRDLSLILDPFLKQAILTNSNGGGPMPLPGAGVPDPNFLNPQTFYKLEVDGSSKIPSLRNVGLTPPYFSWGGYSSLRQVLKLYNRGISRRDITGPGTFNAHGTGCVTGDDSGTGPDGNHVWPMPGVTNCATNVTGLIVPLGLTDCDAPAGTAPKLACTAANETTENDDLAALTRFMLSLTDARVQCDQAPFDHPQLKVTDGHFITDFNRDGEADDITFNFPAVGAAGYKPKSGYCIPNSGDLFAPGMQAREGGMLNR